MNGLFVSIGAGPGIGGSTASRFAREGFDLVLATRDVPKLEPSAQKIRKETGQHVETVALDAADFSAVQQFSDLDGYEPKSLRGIYGGPHPAFDIQ